MSLTRGDIVRHKASGKLAVVVMSAEEYRKVLGRDSKNLKIDGWPDMVWLSYDFAVDGEGFCHEIALERGFITIDGKFIAYD